MPLPRYDISKSYDWNYDHPPTHAPTGEPGVPGVWSFCRQRVASPLGVAAGPLLNGAWCLYYATLGFDVVTYKTVRSRERACYPTPNLLPVQTGSLAGGETDLSASEQMGGSWAISFGMPSKPPEVWTADVQATRRRLPKRVRLSVSVVASAEPDWPIEQVADDYAECARMAAEAGADAIEVNLSCPNVTSCDGQLYQNPRHATLVAERTRAAIGELPLVCKIGHFAEDDDTPGRLMDALAPHADAVATTNCVAATVRGAFGGQPRGIGGSAILEASVRQVERLAGHAARQGYDLRVIGVGGVSTAADVRRYLSAGAEMTHLATALMVDPEVGLRIRSDLSTP
ncbi:hypothetical protein [Pseudobythopirellula maris]|nr:hypothetical protein [Pseudobythopirellula maris]